MKLYLKNILIYSFISAFIAFLVTLVDVLYGNTYELGQERNKTFGWVLFILNFIISNLFLEQLHEKVGKVKWGAFLVSNLIVFSLGEVIFVLFKMLISGTQEGISATMNYLISLILPIILTLTGFAKCIYLKTGRRKLATVIGFALVLAFLMIIGSLS